MAENAAEAVKTETDSRYKPAHETALLEIEEVVNMILQVGGKNNMASYLDKYEFSIRRTLVNIQRTFYPKDHAMKMADRIDTLRQKLNNAGLSFSVFPDTIANLKSR